MTTVTGTLELDSVAMPISTTYLFTAEPAENAENLESHSSADSRRPGLRVRCTSIAVPVMLSVIWSRFSRSVISALSAFSAVNKYCNAKLDGGRWT